MKSLSVTERQFLTSIIKTGKRLDGRLLTESRALKIKFLQEWGSCIVKLGNTVVFCRIMAEIAAPKTSRPTEGVIHVNLTLSSLLHSYVTSKSSNEYVNLHSSLQRCVLESNCVELESLCIIAGVKVWRINVDIFPLNDDGNIVECGSIAAICALAHFKRPDVSVIGTDVTLHSLQAREPVCLSICHMPIAVNACICAGGSVVMDPIKEEELIADGYFYVCANMHHEICFVSKKGSVLLSNDAVVNCIALAIKRAQNVTDEIRSALHFDSLKRAAKVGMVFNTSTLLSSKAPIYRLYLKENETE